MPGRPRAPRTPRCPTARGRFGTGCRPCRRLLRHPCALCRGTGADPAQRRRKGAGETLRYALAPCPLLLLAASDKGICALLFGDDEAALEQELRSRFAAADLAAIRPGWATGCRRSSASWKNRSAPPSCRSTCAAQPFSSASGRRCSRFPPARHAATASWRQPSAATRGRWRACASNPIGLLVPCHRVVGSQNALTGYRWGLARKARLLDREGQGESGA